MLVYVLKKDIENESYHSVQEAASMRYSKRIIAGILSECKLLLCQMCNILQMCDFQKYAYWNR